MGKGGILPKHRGKLRELPIGPRTQQILLPYLEACKDNPEQFVFLRPKAKDYHQHFLVPILHGGILCSPLPAPRPTSTPCSTKNSMLCSPKANKSWTLPNMVAPSTTSTTSSAPRGAARHSRSERPPARALCPHAFQRSICSCVVPSSPMFCPVNCGKPFNASLRTVALVSSKYRNRIGTN